MQTEKMMQMHQTQKMHPWILNRPFQTLPTQPTVQTILDRQMIQETIRQMSLMKK